MRTDTFRSILLTSGLAGAIVLLAGAVSVAQQQVNLTAGPSTATLPDGSTVPMWGYSCGTAVGGSTATCAKLNPSAAGWSPVVITLPTGQGLQINLTNSLSFGSTPNEIPTSVVIVGQLGGGLGTPGSYTASPDHSNAQQATWPVADPGTVGNPPAQGPRVQSFSTEVAAGTTTSLTWNAPRPGTYLIESGTHPSIQGPMGLYGVLVVTSAPSAGGPGTAYPGVTYGADVPLLLGEIDPVQNAAVDAAVNTAGFSETMVWSGQAGGCGNPSSPTYHQCYPPAVNYAPLYYLINGVAFDKTNASASLFAATPASGVTGSVLVRLVNAGLRMHVPSIVGAETGSPAGSGFSLVAEDGNPLPGAARVQSEVFLAAGKTYDVLINAPAAGGTALPVFDRQLSLSGNATTRDAGMLAYLSVNGAGLPSAGALAPATAGNDTYNSIIPCTTPPCQTVTVSDPGNGVIANDTNVNGVQLLAGPTGGSVTLNANGTFTYVPNSGTSADSFTYCANGTVTGMTCSSGITATVTLGNAAIEAATGMTLGNDAYTGTVATSLSIATPGVLANDTDAAGYPLTVATSSVTPASGLTVTMDKSGGFTASVAAAGTYTFTYQAQNAQGTVSAGTATVTLTFPSASNRAVAVKDGKTGATLTDYRWIIEEDRTLYIDPTKTTNTGGGTVVPTFGTNFHSSYMPVVAAGCTGPLSCESGQTLQGQAAVCDVGNGACRTTGTQQAALDPGQVHLDPAKRYYISILPGDAADPGHAMGGAPISAGQTSVTAIVEAAPLPTAKVSVFVFEDDFPLNGEHDAGGGIDVLASNEPGLGDFNITLFDDVGGTGDAAGQMTYDMFNMPLSNSLAGTIDPGTGLDACPISKQATADPSQKGITGVIPVCPRYESDGTTLSPLAGQAVVANLPPGRYGVVATPGARRIGRGEEWLQTNTLDGGKAHDSFIKANEPGYFQEYGPAGYHVAIGFANPQIINARRAEVCSGAGGCGSTVTGKVTGVHMSRTPDERLYSTGSRDTFGYTQCYASLGSPDGADFAFSKCDEDGKFSFSVPEGDWRITIFDQWNDQIVDGISTPVRVSGSMVDMGDVAVHGWKANLYTRTFIDQNGDGVSQPGEPGLPLVPTNIRFRDGSYSNFNSTDLDGYAGFNEIFPLFNWYVVETDSTRYKNTGTHVVYDAGGPVDGSPSCGVSGYPPCGPGSPSISANLANTNELVSLPANLRFPGSVYCSNADCSGFSIANGPGSSASSGLSSGRIDPPWVASYGWQGFIGQSSFLEFGKKPFKEGENGGIHGHVVYASTRPFDDPALLLQLSWEPLVPNVTINLYQVGTAPDGSRSLTMVDTTKTSSFDDWAQGFRSDGVRNMNCPGQSTNDPFYFTLFNQPNYLNPGPPLVDNSQFKCYDGLHNFNQLQPAPYDGMYSFPSIVDRDPHSGAATGTGATNGAPGALPGTNCTVCVPNPDDGTPMLPTGKYVVEMVMPPGYELVKEEDKNILLGDAYIAPVTQQFGGLSNIFIMPDQAAIGSNYNPNNPLNPTIDLGAQPRHEGDTGSVETFWPCVGAARVVPDLMSLFPQSGQNAPFAGATRNLCDRKEVILEDQMSVLAKFYVFTSTHVAAHFTGLITDDFTAEFDPFSPSFGEKFAPANLPVSVKNWAGHEVARVYADQWGAYNGLNYSSYGVNPPDPSGYVPTMMVVCMNDAGSGQTPDPLFNPSYSQFCYEIPFMPGQTQYMDTPVVPNSAFAGAGYNNPDCAYSDAMPAVKEVNGDGVGPYIGAPGTGHPITIKALGDQMVNNYGYSGPSATSAPYNQKTVSRHYGFGATQGSGAVTIGGIPATVTSWSDAQIVVTLPNTGPQVPLCAQQQQAQYGGSAARCGELVVTAGNGKKSVDAVTVTIGGKSPIVVAGGQSIQAAIDAALPGDLIIVGPGTYRELVIMWKPVRLQGVGAASSVIDASTHPAGVVDPWRAKMVCLFGLALNGTPATGSNPFDPSGGITCGGWPGFNGGPNNPQVDRMPLEGIVGWDATLNGNLAEQLQEPTLLGAYEGAGITVVAKGVRYPAGAEFIFGNGPGTGSVATEGQFPVGTILLTNSAADCNTLSGSPSTQTGFASNFLCNPSRIDGLSVTDSSQGGGGILLHGWAHNLEISNNRVFNNTGSLSGGITVGMAETPDALLAGNNGDPPGFDQQPWTCNSLVPGAVSTNGTQNVSPPGVLAGTQLPFCHNLNVNLHNNFVANNSSIGDELFAATPSGAGGVTLGPGADGYRLTDNWICGNLSTGDGGGVSHLGYSRNGTIERNAILFNQSTNPTIPANGGGIIVMTTAPDGLTATGLECGSVTDVDCAPGLGDGTGPGLKINANLIMGNAAEAGSGGGIRFQGVNGTEVSRFPLQPGQWYSVDVTNNIIANNVAGWDGGGVSLQDSLAVNLVNNTIDSNDTTASAGTLFNTFRSGLASAPPPGPCTANCGTDSPPQAAGISATGNSAGLIGSLPPVVLCPAGHTTGLTNPLLPLPVPNGDCREVSFPILYNNLIWQNRAFHITVAPLSPQYQQSVVTLVPALNQTATGQCVSGASYWDIGVRGDTGPTDHSSGVTLTPVSSVVTAGYGGNHNSNTNPTVVKQYCNGSRIPPEFGGTGYQVPPGTNEGNVPVPVFNLTAGATVDEGNNWINISWGPLATTNPSTGAVLGDYTLSPGSPAINYITLLNSLTTYVAAPTSDFFGKPRKTAADPQVDAGAVEVAPPVVAIASVAPTTLTFSAIVGTTSAAQSLTVSNTGGASLTGIAVAVTAPFSRSGGSCGTTLAAGANCTINVVFSPTAVGTAAGTATITGSVTVAGSPVALSGTGVPVTRTASVAPSPLAVGNWATGTTSNARTLTVTNTGNAALSGGTFTFGGGTPQPFSRPSGSAGGTCGASLAVSASCTINVVFAPTTATAFSRTLTVAYTGATVTPTPASLTGTGVATRASVSITPNPLTITLPSGVNTGTGTVTLTNTAAAGGAQMTVTSVAASGGSLLTYLFTNGPLAGPDTCTGTTLAPGASCTVAVRFTNVFSPRGPTRTGTITFTDNGLGSPQTGALQGVATP